MTAPTRTRPARPDRTRAAGAAPARATRGGAKRRPAERAKPQPSKAKRSGAAPSRAAASKKPRPAKRASGGAPASARRAAPPRRTNAGRTGPPRRPRASRTPAPAANPARRMRVLTLTVLFVVTIFAGQLVRIQGVDAHEVATEAQGKRAATEAIPANRGRIVSADGTVLASSVVREVVVADQSAVCTYGVKERACSPETSAAAIDKAAAALAPHLPLTKEQLIPMLTGTNRYRILSKNVTPLQWNTISKLAIPGIYSDRRATSSLRTYPQGSTASALIGYTYSGGAGGGVELMMDSALHGSPGKLRYEQGRDGTMIPMSSEVVDPAKDGRDVQLTIDSGLQWYAQNSLAKRVRETGAKEGTVVAINVKTGELLCVASYPTFDPATDVGKSGAALENKAFTDVFEPGSTAKIMTVAAAMEEGRVSPSTPVIIPNRLPRYDTAFRDSHEHGVEYGTVAGALAQSSNIGTILIGETMKSGTLEKYFRSFGLGSTSGVGYPGESKGLLPGSDQWSGTQAKTVMFGQGMSVTAIQAASVFQTIANGGVRVSPRLVKAVQNGDGDLEAAPPSSRSRVVSERVSREMTRMLEGVVTAEGTAPEAQVAGYRVAGKTGTADRYDSAVGRYRGKTASFIGYAPADNPQIAIAVIVQDPKKPYYGGVVAGPVFRDVMTYALQEYAVPPNNSKPDLLKLAVDPSEALADPRTLRDGGTRRDG